MCFLLLFGCLLRSRPRPRPPAPSFVVLALGLPPRKCMYLGEREGGGGFSTSISAAFFALSAPVPVPSFFALLLAHSRVGRCHRVAVWLPAPAARWPQRREWADEDPPPALLPFSPSLSPLPAGPAVVGDQDAQKIAFEKEEDDDGDMVKVELGAGSFGRVYAGAFRGHAVAIKQMPIVGEAGARDFRPSPAGSRTRTSLGASGAWSRPSTPSLWSSGWKPRSIRAFTKCRWRCPWRSPWRRSARARGSANGPMSHVCASSITSKWARSSSAAFRVETACIQYLLPIF